jgi:hypothetical protein
MLQAPHGEAVFIQTCGGGTGRVHVCECLKDGGGNAIRCIYYTSATNPSPGGFNGIGGCEWITVGNTKQCFDVTCTASGAFIVEVDIQQ